MGHSPNPALDPDVETGSFCSDSDSEFSVNLEFLIIDSEFPMYGVGGYHPVHLGDVYDNGRYRVVHKINYGDTSTIWLARDFSSCSWVALRILQPDESTKVEENIIRSHDILAQGGEDDPRFITSTQYFHTDGPNGRHLCLVLPFCGPSLASLSNYVSSRMKPEFARKLAYQAAEIVKDLHAHGICHGDIRPGNFLLQIRNLGHLDDQAICRLFGQPKIDLLKSLTGEVPGPEAPRYVVSPFDFMSSCEDILLDKVSIIGFDHSFHISSPRITQPLPEFLAPEVAIGKEASLASDVWALGVIILNMRSGILLFNPSCVECPSFVVTECLKYFRELPSTWEEPLYDRQGRPTQDKTRGRPRETSGEVLSLKNWISDIWDEPTQENENKSPPAVPWTVKPEHRSRPTGCDWLTDEIAAIINYDPKEIGHLNGSVDDSEEPYPQHYANRVWKPSAFKINGRYLPEVGEMGESFDVKDNLASLPRISAQEVDLLYDLLTKVFVYEGRVSAEDILGHPWLTIVKEKV
ncbi:hypothetical protein FGRMN_7955 [Fusarium graminum]|nr:hypothetical protein FGRMN_7955 [Fusarium graminum]